MKAVELWCMRNGKKTDIEKLLKNKGKSMSIDTYRKALVKLDEFGKIAGTLPCKTRYYLEEPFDIIKQIIEHDLEDLELIKTSKSIK